MKFTAEHEALRRTARQFVENELNPFIPEWEAAGRFPIIRPRKDEIAPPFDDILQAEKAKEREEHFRLLYVALTRAGERLIVTGLKPSKKMSADSWHSVVGEAMCTRARTPSSTRAGSCSQADLKKPSSGRNMTTHSGLSANCAQYCGWPASFL